MRSRLACCWIAALLAAGAGLSGCGDDPENASTRPFLTSSGERPSADEPLHTPNVLILTIDTLRADHLGAHGYVRETSPRLDRLAEESIVFERAYAPIATTLPSHTSMFTGVAPHEHGVLANIADGMTYQRDPELETLAEFFSRAGYDARAVVSAFPLIDSFGLATGFQSYSQPQRKQRGAKAATNAAIEALDELSAGNQPGLLWVHYFDPHVPYHPPEAYRDRFQLTTSEHDALLARGFVESAQRRTGEWSDLAESIDLYDEEIAFVDDQIERLLAHGEELGWLKDAIIVVMADHGEGLNQHGMPGHGFVWAEQLQVPMWFRAPGHEPRRMTDPVSLVDFAPTLLHLVELPNEAAFLEQMSGVDRLDPTIHHGDARLLGQSSPLQSVDGGIHYTLQAAHWRLHLAPDGRRQLFDLRSDPDEVTDVSAMETTVTDRLEAELLELLARQRRAVRTQTTSDAVREDLRALGYGGEDPGK
ncbi:Arylsulfatase [Planctomycetes bacterium Poly30]|uniref:Arylsulfatase n=1 Tax=Saltatorellus ferox TaxID=2528018 RepID=A0A518EKE3_9BACT|nr:Arylsulfatase [Planctomycetes bacterium Poly30]